MDEAESGSDCPDFDLIGNRVTDDFHYDNANASNSNSNINESIERSSSLSSSNNLGNIGNSRIFSHSSFAEDDRRQRPKNRRRRISDSSESDFKMQFPLNSLSNVNGNSSTSINDFQVNGNETIPAEIGQTLMRQCEQMTSQLSSLMESIRTGGKEDDHSSKKIKAMDIETMKPVT